MLAGAYQGEAIRLPDVDMDQCSKTWIIRLMHCGARNSNLMVQLHYASDNRTKT